MPRSSMRPHAADEHRGAVDRARHAAPDDRLEPGRLVEPELALAGRAHDRLAQRVLGALLEGRGEVEQARLVDAGRRGDRGHGGPAEGERPGLVEHDGVDPAGRLERLAAADEDPGLGALAGADHDRGRRREAHRARAGDDHDPDECREREREPRLRAEQRTRRRTSPTATHDDGRDEDLGDPVGEALDRRLRALRALDELDDPGQGRVAADARRAHHERAGRVERRADDLVAGLLRGRDRLAGEHRLVDRARALDEHAVDRDLVAGPDAEQVARARRPPARRPPRRRCAAAGRSSPAARRAAGSRRSCGPSRGPRATGRGGSGR